MMLLSDQPDIDIIVDITYVYATQSGALYVL